MLTLCDALTAETPTFSPRYIAHMKADLSLPGLLGWFAAMLHNPNNSSRDASRVGVAAVAVRDAVHTAHGEVLLGAGEAAVRRSAGGLVQRTPGEGGGEHREARQVRQPAKARDPPRWP